MGIGESNLEGSERIYRFLLWLYPPGFRLRFGPEMAQVFRDIYPHGLQNVGFATRLAFWLCTVNDLVRSLPGEWRQALIRAGRIEFPVRRWADSVVIPFTVVGYLMAEGTLGATLVRSPGLRWAARACGENCDLASMLKTSVAVALGLAVLGTLSALIVARSSRAEGWWIKL